MKNILTVAVSKNDVSEPVCIFRADFLNSQTCQCTVR